MGYAEKNVNLLLLGNKADIADKKVDESVAKKYAQGKGMKFFEASAKTSENVYASFVELSKELMQKRDDEIMAKTKKFNVAKFSGRKQTPSISRDGDDIFTGEPSVFQEEAVKRLSASQNVNPAIKKNGCC
eukprot:TRINITY_DN17392_c0_g1_i1.p1 TRINITY_DN17392_c0_g1~~TRINITY_DN17392_c0_g1_i1.p1  ORF type:complete len:154 (-),score=48.84 TRINITY_DN17392_c0_g1_i1:18-410(-)